MSITATWAKFSAASNVEVLVEWTPTNWFPRSVIHFILHNVNKWQVFWVHSGRDTCQHHTLGLGTFLLKPECISWHCSCRLLIDFNHPHGWFVSWISVSSNHWQSNSVQLQFNSIFYWGRFLTERNDPEILKVEAMIKAGRILKIPRKGASLFPLLSLILCTGDKAVPQFLATLL